jgi:MoxR-like ATPase
MESKSAVISPRPTAEPKHLMEAVSTVLLDKPEAVELSLVALVAGGHVLLEDVPGVGKTTLAKAMSRTLGLDFRRIQFTSDMLPSDVVGVTVFDTKKGEFIFNPGPVFTGMLLADEINRTPPRTQSALLEAMSEGQVTVDNKTHDLPDPYFVMATQNPLELHGTYPLPESQMDRFMICLSLGYPSDEVERNVITQDEDDVRLDSLPRLVGPEVINGWRKSARAVTAKDELVTYIQAILSETRTTPESLLGASPRAGIQLFRCSRALAWLRGRDYIIPDDIRYLAPYVLSHRLWLHGERGGTDQREQARNVLLRAIDTVPLP